MIFQAPFFRESWERFLLLLPFGRRRLPECGFIIFCGWDFYYKNVFITAKHKNWEELAGNSIIIRFPCNRNIIFIIYGVLGYADNIMLIWIRMFSLQTERVFLEKH